MEKRAVEILSRFNKSWNETEKFYDNLMNDSYWFEKLKSLRQFISTLRQEGEDKYFRAGTSMHILILSRSVDFGLRTDQKRLKIQTLGINDFEIILRGREKIYREYRVKDLSDIRVKNLLRTLKDTLVD